MEKIYSSLTELIGNTPIMEVTRIEEKENLKARLLVKIESFNPGGSAKDRVALAMIEDAERKGKLRKGALIVEPTSGNTGVGLAWVATVKGYRLVLTMPETMSVERQKLLKALGAKLVLTPGKDGMQGAVDKAMEILSENPGSFMPQQFENPANRQAHIDTTAEEIWRDTDGKIDIVLGGIGTGGTLTGVSEGLKRHNPSIKAIAIEPAGSPILSGGKPGPHNLQGIGANFVPGNFHREYADSITAVTDSDAYSAARMLADIEGLLAGISSGAAFWAALQEARKDENKGKMILAILPDTGERYLSTALFNKE